MEAAERETIITWNDVEDTVSVFTCHRKIMAKMERLGATVKDRCVMNGRVRHIEFEIDKGKITISINAKRRGTATQIENLKKARVLSPIGKKKASKTTTVIGEF